MRFNKIQIIALLLSGMLIITSCGGDKDKEKAAASAQAAQQAQPYAVKVVSSQVAVQQNDYPATIKGQEDIEIRPKVDGFIKTMNVDEGSIVRKGQLLFTLDAPQYAQDVLNAKAAIKTAEAQLKTAQMNVNKTTPLVQKGIISKYQLESDQYALESSRAALNQAKTRLAIAETNLGYTYIKSPVDGIVGSIPYRLGSLVNSSTALTTVANTGNVHVYFALNEKALLDFMNNTPGATQAEKISRSEPLELVLADGTVYSEKGTLETINGVINTQTGSANFRANFPNSRGVLRSGSTGFVRIPSTIKDAVVIPQIATFELQGQTFLFTVQPNNKVKQTGVKVEPLPDGKSYLVKEGVKVNDKIVVEGVQNLKDGMEIKPVIK